jgi:CheY-like chemotaxis protein
MEPPKNSKYQILVVDDEPTVSKAIQMMLKFHGHEVEIAGDGAAGLARFDAGKFDLVITDYLMPEMKGDQFVALIKQRRPEQRIIMATAFADDFLSRGKPLGGVDHILIKPFSLDDLRQAIEKAMA